MQGQRRATVETPIETKTEEYEGYEFKVEIVLDESPDLSWLGQYVSKAPAEFYVNRIDGTLRGRALPEPDECDYEDKTGEVDYDKYDAAMEVWEDNYNEILEEDLHTAGRHEYEYFVPCASVKDLESLEEWTKYALQDYDRVEGYNRGDWCMTGIVVTLDLGICPTCRKFQSVSNSLWGIESDAGDYADEVFRDLAAQCLKEAGL